MLDGTVKGPNINGIVVPNSGGDFPWVRPDGVIDFDARYLLQTDDGANIYFQSRGYRWGTPEAMAKMARREPVADDSYYMRTVPKFEAPAGQIRLAQSPRVRRAGGEDAGRQSYSLFQGAVTHEYAPSHDFRRGAQPAASFTARPRELFIGGRWQAAQTGETFEVVDPANEQVFARAAAGGEADIDVAVKAARKAFESPPWASMTPAQRARLLLKLADLIEANADEIALLETLDNGMPFRMAKFGGVFGAAESLRYHAGWATKIHGATINLSFPGEWHAYTLREPVGVVGQIVPWNFPFVMGVAKIAPALAVGCTVVLKPAEQTPLTTMRLGELIAEAGFPEGVVNIVTGFGETAGRALVAHPGRRQDRVHRVRPASARKSSRAARAISSA